MIGLLRGDVTPAGEERALIEVQGVGYLVNTPNPALLKGDDPIHVHTVVREDAIDLYGFPTVDDRDVFSTLLTVNGVGPKIALACIGTLGASGVVDAAASGDHKALTAVPGIGTKTAQKAMVELAGKFDGTSVADSTGPGTAGGAVKDAVAALEGLGYSRSEAHGAVTAASADLDDDADEAAVISAALRRLAKG